LLSSSRFSTPGATEVLITRLLLLGSPTARRSLRLLPSWRYVHPRFFLPHLPAFSFLYRLCLISWTRADCRSPRIFYYLSGSSPSSSMRTFSRWCSISGRLARLRLDSFVASRDTSRPLSTRWASTTPALLPVPGTTTWVRSAPALFAISL
jgi:hypothetical protein